MADMQELGRSGLKAQNGVIQEDILPSLRGARGRRTLTEMAENDPVIGGVLLAWEKLLARLEWPIENHPESTDEDRRDFIEECFADMSESWPATISSVLTMAVYGWSYLEIVYKKRSGESDDPSKKSNFTDGKIGWRKWAIRGQDTLVLWELDENGGIQGMRQQTEDGPRTIPIEKALLFRTTSVKNNPEGRSLLRSAYRPWYFKKRIEEFEAIGIERDLAGLPVARVEAKYFDSNALPADKELLEHMLRIVSTVKRNEAEGLVFPIAYDSNGHKLIDFELMSAGGSRQFDMDKVITRYNQQIAMSMLADFIMLGHENVGTQALGASKIDLWLMAVEAIARSIIEVINTHAIPRLLRLNGMSTENPPQMRFSSVEQVDLVALGTYVKNLMDAGVLLADLDLEEHLREVGKLPPVSQDRDKEDMGAYDKTPPMPFIPQPPALEEEPGDTDDEDEGDE